MERNSIILGFFKCVMGENFNYESFATAISGAIESIYYLRNKNFIGPLAFAKSLFLYTKTGALICAILYLSVSTCNQARSGTGWGGDRGMLSPPPPPTFYRNKDFSVISPAYLSYSLNIHKKQRRTYIVSADRPSGSYTLTLKWLKAHGKERIRCLGDNDIISFFANNQVNKFLKMFSIHL